MQADTAGWWTQLWRRMRGRCASCGSKPVDWTIAGMHLDVQFFGSRVGLPNSETTVIITDFPATGCPNKCAEQVPTSEAERMFSFAGRRAAMGDTSFLVDGRVSYTDLRKYYARIVGRNLARLQGVTS